ncbi:hypothetical protein [Allofournierella massiliensis]|uniref:hypothetical protein n=1 Tax=Allofournierella massiliensis TaxID=1650663 RepID=UPI0025A34A44|nr:hypothetical protein [Fournierella massiliensis]
MYLLLFSNGYLPDCYVIPSQTWTIPNALFVERNYDKPGQKSAPEWGINLSKKNLPLLEPYKEERYFRYAKAKEY